ncbi:VCBS repeat-containing protein [Streptomyces sp. WAC08241]|uniref:FG-GAP repeat domain-containing protein n=1 Tax=Streptomyces sp. WAC08241 TaxID=2487421 RepID=UPI000F7927E5|nr:VCBS repeat-containing protein [Streptomyces sp. WAC08241]RSS37660.1 VCBS repeat-containing protein [Streptomyces sp. WAC08241]
MRLSSSRRSAAAIAAVLAVTLGTGALAVPAVAAPAGPAATATTTTTTTNAISIPGLTHVVGAGPSGFLSYGPGANGSFSEPIYRWTSTVDGTTTTLPAQSAYYGGFSDVVVTKEPTRATYRMYDMSQPGSAYLSLSVSGSPTLRAVVGSTLVVSTWDETSSAGELRLVTRNAHDVSDRPVTGLPANARVLSSKAASASTVLVRYSTRDAESVVHHHLAVVDVPTASIAEDREIGNAIYSGDTALSASHLAWVETAGTTATLRYAERGAGTTAGSIPLENRTGTRLAFVGRWLTYASPGADMATAPNALHALTALDPTTGATVKLLDTVLSSVAAPDGSVLVRGGTVAQGEGVYRISDTGGAPSVTLVASTGRPTALKLLAKTVPATVEFDRTDGMASMEWQLSRGLASGTLTVRHVRTGTTVIDRPFDSSLNWPGGSGFLEVEWDDRTGSPHAPNGEYVWELNATPKNGIGPALKETGTLTVVREPNAHDFNDNGSPDLLALDADGVLWRDDVFHSRWSDGINGYRTKVGAGFQAYDLIEAAGDLAGGAAGDFVARDRSGVLWSFLGKGDGTFAPRTGLGTGWGVYNKIAAGSDLTGDGRPDLVAVDAAGALWLHKATGKWDAPYTTARVKLAAGGFNAYDQLTAVGDIAGATAGDVVARDTDGVLWSFLGKGDGTFAPRTRIGGGWNAFSQIVGTGDIDRDGRSDLVGYGPETHPYLGTGVWSAPFGPKLYGQLYYGEGAKFRNVT